MNLIKRNLFLISLIIGVSYSHAKNPRKKNYNWRFYSHDQVKEIQSQKRIEYREKIVLYLALAKKAIVDGNLAKAEHLLSEINETQSPLAPIKLRIQSLIEFIKGNFERSYELINSPYFNAVDIYPNICMMRVLNLFAMNKDDEYDKEIRGCQNLTFDFARNDHIWLRATTEVKLKNPNYVTGRGYEGLRQVLNTNDYLITWLKLGIYLNKDQQILKYIPRFPPRAFQSKKIRELMGLVLYRTGDTDKAVEFIEDISTPNTENIMGNIKLANKQYELAFGHFNLALQLKKNSLNALERAIPLAWILEQWDEGQRLLNRFIKKTQDKRKKLALQTAFKIKLDKIKEARSDLKNLSFQFKQKVPKKVNLMNTYVALRSGNIPEMLEYADRSCRSFEGISCMMMFYSLTWENIGKTLDRRDEIYRRNDLLYDQLREKTAIVPLEEKIVIDQKDIEELDSKLVNIDVDYLKNGADSK